MKLCFIPLELFKMAWEFLQNHMFKDGLITLWNYLFSGNAQLSRQVSGLIKASFNNVVVNFKWFLLLYVIFGMLFYFFFYEIMKTFFKFLIFLLLTNVVVLSRLTKFWTIFILRKGPSTKDVRTFFSIFDPYPPHVCNRLHFEDPSLKRMSANREFAPPPPQSTFDSTLNKV